MTPTRTHSGHRRPARCEACGTRTKALTATNVTPAALRTVAKEAGMPDMYVWLCDAPLACLRIQMGTRS